MLKILLMVIILTSCAGNQKKIAPQESSGGNGLSQVSVLQDSSCNTGMYDEFNRLKTDGPLIPGLGDFPVPQGMAYLKDADQMIISNYMSDGSAGILTVLNMDDGTFIKEIHLYNHDTTPHTGHLGGLAVSRDHLWIASGKGVYFLAIQDLLSAENLDRVYLPPRIDTETKASFATFNDGVLWIGEFTREDGTYSVPALHHRTNRTGGSHRGWLGGYRLDSQTDMIDRENLPGEKVIPDLILSIPDEIQGAVFYRDMILLSASYGRKNFSRLYYYESPLGGPVHSDDKILPEREIPFWFLDELNLKGSLIVPPMSEAVVLYKKRFALLFESAASKYRDTAHCPLERIQYLSADSFILTERE